MLCDNIRDTCEFGKPLLTLSSSRVDSLSCQLLFFLDGFRVAGRVELREYLAASIAVEDGLDKEAHIIVSTELSGHSGCEIGYQSSKIRDFWNSGSPMTLLWTPLHQRQTARSRLSVVIRVSLLAAWDSRTLQTIRMLEKPCTEFQARHKCQPWYIAALNHHRSHYHNRSKLTLRIV